MTSPDGPARRRDGSWAPLLAAVSLAVLSLLLLAVLSTRGGEERPATPSPTPSSAAD